jgi:hypothetical protein
MEPSHVVCGELESEGHRARPVALCLKHGEVFVESLASDGKSNVGPLHFLRSHGISHPLNRLLKLFYKLNGSRADANDREAAGRKAIFLCHGR